MLDDTKTLIACLTPPGKAAVATLSVRGPLAWRLTHELFRPRQGALPETPTRHQVWLGRHGEESRDEASLAVKQITPQTWREIHCHGGPAVVQMIEELL